MRKGRVGQRPDVVNASIPALSMLFMIPRTCLTIALCSLVVASHMKVDPIPVWGVIAWYVCLLLGAFRWHARRVGARRE